MPAMNQSIRTFVRRSFYNTQSPQTRSSSTQFRRSEFSGAGQGFTGSYEPNAPTVGPLSQASKFGAPRLTPSLLKEHLDKFVVGQAKAKKVTSVAIFNHYQRIRELRRLEQEEQAKRDQEARRALKERERNAHPLENEFPGHLAAVEWDQSPVQDEPDLGSKPLEENDMTMIEKSNLLLLGPSGVGKTYILQTLSRILEVPFATVDCSSLTQAGYIGTDIESSIERLLLASSHSISACETGIIFFDEVDKLAKPAVMTHGRDVSGEGVQQGLLKMIEGTTVTVSGKGEKTRESEKDGGASSNGFRGREGRDAGSLNQSGGAGRNEQYTIDTTNILFVFAGAFIGLEKIILSRLQAGTSLGFNASLPVSTSSSSPSKKTANAPPESPLDHCTPTDLQSYGLIPELLGRIPILTTLHPLSLPHLVSILTQPRNSLVRQYTALFKTYSIDLRFTTLALHAIAARAIASPSTKSRLEGKGSLGAGTGARGLRSIMESVLAEIMFWGPGSGIRYCLVDEAFVRGFDDPDSRLRSQSGMEEAMSRGGADGSGGRGDLAGDSEGGVLMPKCWSRGQGRLFEEVWEREEAVWRDRDGKGAGAGEDRIEEKGTFERLREVGGSGM